MTLIDDGYLDEPPPPPPLRLPVGASVARADPRVGVVVSAQCRCWCGCDRVSRDLDDATSSDLTCRLCLMDRHIARHPMLIERIEELEFAVRQLEKRVGVPAGERLSAVPR